MSERATTRDHRLAIGACFAIALLFVGGTIGAWVYGSLRQRRAVERLGGGRVSVGSIVQTGPRRATECNADGPILYDYQLAENLQTIDGDPPGPDWLREWLGIDFVSTVRGATLWGGQDEAKAALLALPGLRSLTLADDAAPQIIQQLPRFAELEQLGLWWYPAPIDEQTFAILSQLPRLRNLQFVRCSGLTDDALDQIGKITALRGLTLIGCEKLTDAGIKRLGRLVNLEQLSLRLDANVSDAVLEFLASFPHLRELALYCDVDRPLRGLNFLGALPELTKLDIQGGEALTDEGFSELPILSSLTELILTDCRQLHAAGLANLAKFPNLQSLSIHRMIWLDDGCVEHFKRLPKLTRLTIDANGTDLTDDGLVGLAELSKLERLQLWADGYDRFSPEAVESLRTMLPKCVIDYKPRAKAFLYWP